MSLQQLMASKQEAESHFNNFLEPILEQLSLRNLVDDRRQYAYHSLMNYIASSTSQLFGYNSSLDMRCCSSDIWMGLGMIDKVIDDYDCADPLGFVLSAKLFITGKSIMGEFEPSSFTEENTLRFVELIGREYDPSYLLRSLCNLEEGVRREFSATSIYDRYVASAIQGAASGEVSGDIITHYLPAMGSSTRDSLMKFLSCTGRSANHYDDLHDKEAERMQLGVVTKLYHTTLTSYGVLRNAFMAGIFSGNYSGAYTLLRAPHKMNNTSK